MMDDDYQRFDEMLMEILQKRKTIDGFLDAMFGFLNRNTDFFHTKTHADEKIGFDPGMREQVVFSTLQRYYPTFLSAAESYSANGETAPAALEEITIDSADAVSTNSLSLPNKHCSEACFTKSDYKNGAKYESYCWSQTLKDLELHVRLPEDLQHAKQLSIQINSESVAVSSRSQPERVIVAGKLSGRIKQNDVVWTIDAGLMLISCDKAREHWWERLFIGEDSIDVKKLDCEQYIDELPEDTQAVIEKMRWQNLAAEQQQQAASAENFDRLRKAWNVEGSPFQGQPFDPAAVRFS